MGLLISQAFNQQCPSLTYTPCTGRAVAVLFAMEGADVAINYLPEEQPDAEDTKREIQKLAPGRKVALLPADISKGEQVCKGLIEKTVKELGKLDCLVNNAATQYEVRSIKELSE